MTEQQSIDQLYTPGFWSTLNRVFDWLTQTEVNLLVVVTLFMLYGIREMIGLYLKWRTQK